MDNRFYTNTYITGSGRRNYLRIDELEDPLFTSFTFDIDFVSSPLFYTINRTNYEYPDITAVGENIEAALSEIHKDILKEDQGYDILPHLSASILDDNKLGFGLQQNVYMDLPLYGATEYIYMVDKRNGGADQNDARFDNNRYINNSGANSYKLGDSVKSIVNDSDRAWAERNRKQNEEQMVSCQEILDNKDVQSEHEKNLDDFKLAEDECNNNNKIKIEGQEKEYTESELVNEIDKYNKIEEEFEQLKREIAEWANKELLQYQNKVRNEYMNNDCIQKIASYTDRSNMIKELETSFGEDYFEKYIYGSDNSYLNKINKIYNELETYTDHWSDYAKPDESDSNSFLIETENGDGRSTIRSSKVINKFGDRLVQFGLYNKDNKEFKGKIQAIEQKTPPDWLYESSDGIEYLLTSSNSSLKDIVSMSKSIMSFECDKDTSFSEFGSDIITENDNKISIYQRALENLRLGLYGEEGGTPCDISNPTPDSKYGQYLAAKEKCENDDYSQAQKSKMLAESGYNTMSEMIKQDDDSQKILDDSYNKSVETGAQPEEVSRKKPFAALQTVFDMLEFISGMKKLVMRYPYIIQGVTGLDVAYNNHYIIKDPYLGSGENKITLTCLESLDLRVSSMFNRYFNAVYDRQYRRERVPINLRRFNCTIYVHDVRNFLSIMRLDKKGNHKITYNRILELTDMYYSVIEFRFYDCEIVPEETGNIFNSVSNEAPSEMTKTNFTFTYGNCVINFVPPSEVAAHNAKLNEKSQG